MDQTLSTRLVAALTTCAHVLLGLLCYSVSCIPSAATAPSKMRINAFVAQQARPAKMRANVVAQEEAQKLEEAQDLLPLEKVQQAQPTVKPQEAKPITQETKPPEKVQEAKPTAKIQKTKPAKKVQEVKPAAKALPKTTAQPVKTPPKGADIQKRKQLFDKAQKAMQLVQEQSAVNLPSKASFSLASEATLNALPESIGAPYAEEIAALLKLLLSLPERAEVEMALTLSRLGKVLRVEPSSNSSRNCAYVQQHIKAMAFPPFGKDFPDEAEHTFSIKLSVEIQ